jgi:hypothetical protein
VTETARRLHRLGSPHARACAFAALLAGSGITLVMASAGVWLAPHVAAVAASWIGVVLALVLTLFAARRAARSTTPPALARAAELAAGARTGSIATIVASPTHSWPGASAELFEVADRRAAELVTSAAPQLARTLRLAEMRRLGLGVVIAGVGAALFLATAPTNSRAAGFWHPLRALALARAPVRLSLDRTSVRRGDSVRATITVPGAVGGRVTLWTRRPGEPWRPTLVPLDSAGVATRHLGPLDTDLWARAAQGSRRSRELRVTVADPAFLADVSVVAQFPAYLNRADEPIPPGPDTVPLPMGTTLVSRGLASVPLAAASWRAAAGGGASLRVDGPRFDGGFAPGTGGLWRLSLATVDGSPLEGESPILVLRLVPDSAPTVGVPIPGRDTTLPLSMIQPLVIDARDDHGVARLSIVSWRASQSGAVGTAVRESLDVQGAGDRVILQAALRAEQRGLLPGDTLRFRVEAWDNAPTPHEGRSPEFALRLPSRAELRAAQREAAADIAAAADSIGRAQRALSEHTADLAQERQRDATAGTSGRQPSSQQGALPFQSSERARELARQQEAVSERVRELTQNLDDLARAARAAGIEDTAFQARLREVQEMLSRAVTPELEQRLRDLQAALARLDPDATRDALRRLADAQQQLRETLERSQELFRRAAIEGELASLAQDAEALRNEQARWNERSAPRADSVAAAAQRALAERADSLAAGIQQAGRDLAAAQHAAADSQNALTQPMDQARRAGDAMEQAAGNADRRDARGARQSGEQAQQALDSLPERLRRRREAVAGQWRQEAIDALDQALTETAALAERQRAVSRALESGANPAKTRAQQAALEEGAAAVQQQIRDAGGRHALVSPGIQSALGFAQRQMRAASQQLEQAQPNTEAAAQLAGEALDALNVTAYALAQSRAEVAGAQSGSGFQEAVERLAQLAGQQQGLNQDAMGLMPMAGNGGEQMMQQIRALAARQRALAEQLERLQASGGSSAAGPLAEEARELARQLDAGRLDRPTIERQERLYRRLLDAGRTLSGQEPDENKERTSRSASGDSVHVPVLLNPDATAGPRFRYPSWRDLERMTPEQRRLVLEYFRLLNAPH